MMAMWHVAKASSSKFNDCLPESQQNPNVLSSSQKVRSKDNFPILSQCGYLRWSIAANNVVCSPIWPKIKLIQDIMPYYLEA